jgi:hypothetical protein
MVQFFKLEGSVLAATAISPYCASAIVRLLALCEVQQV